MILMPRPLLWPMYLCLAALLGLFGLMGSLIPVYHAILLVLVRPWVERRQARWRVPGGLLRFVALGLMAVAAEELLVGLIAALQGGALRLVLIRPLQFMAFNLLAFLPILLAMGIVTRRWRPGPWDALVIGGGWGIWAEGLAPALIQAPLMAGLLLLPTAGVYALILTPALLSAPGQVARPLWLRAAAIWALGLALAVPVIGGLGALRQAHPWAFPPCDWIACQPNSSRANSSAETRASTSPSVL